MTVQLTNKATSQTNSNHRKLNLLIVDDSFEICDRIISEILDSEQLIEKEECIELMYRYFNVKVFSSSRDTITFLRSEKWQPDIVSMDWNYENLPSDIYPPEDRARDSGKILWGFLKENYPEALVNVHTKHFKRGITDIVPSSNVSPTHETYEDVRSFMDKNLKTTIKKYFQKLRRDPKKLQSLQNILYRAENAQSLLSAEVTIGTNQVYRLDNLLAGYAKGGYDAEGNPNLIFPCLVELKNIVFDLLSKDELGDFCGQLQNDNVQKIFKAYLAHPNHQNWVDEIRKDVMDIRELARELYRLDKVKDPELKHPLLLNNILENLHQLSKGTADLDKPTLDTLLRLLKCRLIILDICHQKQLNSKGFLQNIVILKQIKMGIITTPQIFEKFSMKIWV
jgi:hypothetical protein